MREFSDSKQTRVEAGIDRIDSLGEFAREFGARRVLLVTDAGIVRAGHVARAVDALTSVDLTVEVFDQVHENPTTLDVEACAARARAFEPNLYVAVGGGSSIDVAKGSNFVTAGGGVMADYRGSGTARGTLLPLIAVPTTAGTGSEMQSYTLIGDAETHQKMACGDPQAAAKIAILDPTLTLSQPRFVTACTGLDAIGHAVECAVTTARNEVSARCATTAFRLANAAFPRVLEHGDDLAVRAEMLHGAALAGLAIEHSMLGAAHSMANPLTAHYDIAHGEAVALALPVVVRFNAQSPEVRDRYADLARAASVCAADADSSAALESLCTRLDFFLELAGVASLSERGITDDAAPELAAEAATQWTAQFNPRSVDVDDFLGLYRRALAG